MYGDKICKKKLKTYNILHRTMLCKRQSGHIYFKIIFLSTASFVTWGYGPAPVSVYVHFIIMEWLWLAGCLTDKLCEWELATCCMLEQIKASVFLIFIKKMSFLLPSLPPRINPSLNPNRKYVIVIISAGHRKNRIAYGKCWVERTLSHSYCGQELQQDVKEVEIISNQIQLCQFQ